MIKKCIGLIECDTTAPHAAIDFQMNRERSTQSNGCQRIHLVRIHHHQFKTSGGEQAGDGGVGTEAVWRWSPASPTSPTSPATAALRTTLAAVLGGALPCLALASPANQQVATMYVLAAVLAVLHSAALGGAVRLLSRRVSGRPSTLGAVVHSSCAPLLAFE